MNKDRCNCREEVKKEGKIRGRKEYLMSGEVGGVY